MRLIRVLCVSAAMLLLGACAFETPVPETPTPRQVPTQAFTPIVLQPTNTPVPPPPTPTPAPTSTSAPTSSVPTAGASTTATPAPALSTEMVDIPAGSFKMGSDADSPDAKPAHAVDVAAYKIDKFEVTNADFKKFVDATAYKTDAEKAGDKAWTAFAQGKDNHPVVKVTWNDAGAFCKWASKRLPTEAEWEKAARGTDGRAFPWGPAWDPKKANVKDTGIRGTSAVGSFPAGASALGVMDLAGNVWEWTADVAKPYPGNTTPSKLYGANLYVIRGGGWFDAQDQVASSFRNSAVVSTANDDLGFRCAR